MTEREIEQLLDSEARLNRQALDHIRSLTSDHAAELRRWCARRRRREAVTRTVFAVCIFFGSCFMYSSVMAKPQYAQITKTGQSDNQQICDAIRSLIEKA
ncbi:MAG: hypothetical protein II975_09500 [Bacteroidales bacterium]|jgi:hypothetical protein|nr:hypothetical protein [Bacteroidales bacterium]